VAGHQAPRLRRQDGLLDPGADLLQLRALPAAQLEREKRDKGILGRRFQLRNRGLRLELAHPDDPSNLSGAQSSPQVQVQ
jgi:hypothetical protein